MKMASIGRIIYNKAVLYFIFGLFLAGCASIREREKTANSYHLPQLDDRIINRNTWEERAMPPLDPIYLTTTIINRFLGKKSKGNATGFFFQSENVVYLVTNKHVIYGDNFHKKNAVPEIDKIEIIVHINKADLSQNETILIELFENKNRVWKEHRREDIDIICIPLVLDRERFVFATVDESLLDTSNIKIAFEKIFIMGYPYGWYDTLYNLPITRIGHLSSPFGVPFHGNPFMLGDVETHAGMSGGPVFMRLKDYETVDAGKSTRHLGETKTILLGVFSGQPLWEIKNKKTGKTIKIPHSLSVIWFGDLIKQIIAQT